MFTTLRRFELGKMLLNLIPVVVGTGIASKLFTELPFGSKILIVPVVLGLVMSATLLLPPSLEEAKGKK